MSNNPKRSALGRGLSALLENSDTDVTSKHVASGQQSSGVVGTVAMIAVDKIETNPFQPRTEFNPEELKNLANSIREQGIIQPITVRKLGYDNFQIISGERRFRASKLVGLTTIPAYIRVASDQEMLEMALVENIQRQDLNAIEIGLSYKKLMDECNLTQNEISQRVGFTPSTISKALKLLKLPPDIQKALIENRISKSHAEELVNIPDIAKQLLLFNKIIAENLSVRDLESMGKNAKQQTSGKKNTNPSQADDHRLIELNKIKNVLSSQFGTKVQLQRSVKGKGKITIPFNDDQDFNRILELLNY